MSDQVKDKTKGNINQQENQQSEEKGKTEGLLPEIKGIPEDVKKLVEAQIADSVKSIKEDYDKKFKEALATEKTKLYDSMETYKTQADSLAKTLKAKEDAEKAEEEARKIETQTAQETKKQMLELKKQMEDFPDRTKKLLEMSEKKYEAELKKRDLEAYKQKKIAESQGKIIPDLVIGDSVEEIDKAVEAAKMRYEEIFSFSKQQVTDQLVKEGKLPEPTKTGEVVDKATKKEQSLEDIFNMSKEEFNKYEENYFKNLK